MEKMGCFEDNMDSRVPSGSASSASGYSLRSRGSSAKISPFCPRSSSRLTQSIIRDHMIAHYKRVYSAKAAIDTSVPKSLLHSVKYNDQLKRGGGVKNGVRPQSAHSLSQRSRASCSPAQSRLSLQYDDSPYRSSSRSMTSTPRPSTSFHPKNIVYPPFNGDFPRPSSERRHPTLQTSLRQRSTFSLEVSGNHQLNYKGFQDPAQKTYSGDLLQKHGQRFTEEKPFTPKTLKSEKSSFLSQYRYYRAPLNASQDSGRKHKDKAEQSTSNRDCAHETDERSQDFTTDHDLSEQDFNHSYSTALREHSLTHKSRHQDVSYSFPRVSYREAKSRLSNSVDAEEEELKYLEFITAVTDDILSRGFISDSVVDRVINRHIDTNRYHLDEGKMRHLLEVLRRDLKEPCNSPINTLNFESEENHPPSSLQHKPDSEETEVEPEQLQLASEVEKTDSIDFTDPILTSTLTPESAKAFVGDPIDLSEDKGSISPQLIKHDSFIEAEIRGKQSDSETQDDSSQSEESERLTKELQDVGAALESLTVSDQSHCENEESEPANAAISEDEF